MPSGGYRSLKRVLLGEKYGVRAEAVAVLRLMQESCIAEFHWQAEIFGSVRRNEYRTRGTAASLRACPLWHVA